MKKKFIKFILIIVLVIVVFPILFYVKAEDNVSTSQEIIAEKGDIRCNPNYLNNGCVEIKDPVTNKVTEVRITIPVDDHYITKVAEKTDTPGEIKIHFESDLVSNIESYGDKDIVVLLDYSSSFGSSKAAALNAISYFGKRVKAERPGFRVAYARFSEVNVGSCTKITKNWSDDPTAPNWGGTKGCSHSAIHSGLNLVYNNLLAPSKHREGVDTILILISDGGFWPTSSYAKRISSKSNVKISYPNCSSKTWNKGSNGVSGNTMEAEAARIRNNGTTIYGIRYPGYYTSGNKKCYSIEDMYTIIGERKRLFQLNNNSNEEKWKNTFDEILASIPASSERVSVIVTDKIGAAFSPSSNTEKVIEIKNGKSEEFIVNIDSTVSNDWYQTNAGFSAKYVINGEEKVVNSNIDNNPEVYWIQEMETIESCSGTASFDKSVKYVDEYYNINCSQGFNDLSGNYQSGYSANIVINDLSPSDKKFDATLGFDAKIKFNSNVKCSYNFDYDKFMSKYNEINEQIKNTSDNKEKYSLQNSLIYINNSLNNYISYTNRLTSYALEFKNQTASMNVIYPNVNNNKIIEFVDDIDSYVNNSSCENAITRNINGISVLTSGTCYTSLSKSMNLPLSCLNVSSATQEICTSESNNQLAGGNLFYPLISEKSGNIIIQIDSVGFLRDTSILLNDCLFDVNKVKVVYRQIDIADPFIQDYSDKTRSIGTNFLSNKYSFVNIIKDNIWSNHYEYKYALSARNVNNIVKSTLSLTEKVNSYLGSNCYFDKNHKYICEFIRNDNNGECNKDYFTNCDIAD